MVNATDLARELDLPNNRVRAQLLVFVEADLLDPIPPGAGKHWYVRKKSDFWEACDSLLKHWSEGIEDDAEGKALIGGTE